MILDHLDALEQALVAAGFPAMSPWWRSTLERFYRSGRRQCVLRCGRRGGKSSTLCRVAVLEALFGEHTIPPGDTGIVGIVSVSRDEGNGRVRSIKAILDALGVAYRPIEGGIELTSKPIAFKVFPASLGGVVGGTWVAGLCDEVARWRDHESGANPATEVLSSLRPTMATQKNARLFLSSSPMGRSDAHAKAYDAGETAFQCVAFARTWEANPSLTEADCRELEPDEETFRREYAGEPWDGSTSSLFTEGALLAVTRHGPAVLGRVRGTTYFAAMDPATRANAWALCVASSRSVGEIVSVNIVRCQEWRAPRGGALDSDATMGEIAGVLGEYGVTECFSDQWSFDSLNALAARYGLELLQEPSTSMSKVQSYERLRRMVNDRAIELPDDPLVRSELLGVRKWISRGGAFTIELDRSGGRHSDHAAAIALCVTKAAADAGGLSPWCSPTFRANAEAMFGGGFSVASFAERDPEVPAYVVTTDHISGTTEIRGNPAGGFGADERATYRRSGPAQFSRAATVLFREAVNVHRESR